MPNNLTDAEIKKALEICSTYKGKCTDCPAFVKVDRSNCKKVLLGAVEIINRLQADLIDKEKQLQEALKSMAVNKTKVIDCEKEINRQKAEIERLEEKNSNLTSDLTSLQNDLTSAKAEIQMLNSRKEIAVPSMRFIDGNPLNGFNLKSNRFVARTVEDVKAEAYKEFAERLCAITKAIPEMKAYFIRENDLDNLLKEMAGENDES